MSTTAPTADFVSRAQSLLTRFHTVRDWSRQLVASLQPEDCVVQSMPDVSPTRWHLAHTTWFFETFVVKPRRENHQPIDQAYEYLFNSYYNTVGRQFPRSQRGLLSRPTMTEVMDYRGQVEEIVTEIVTEAIDQDTDHAAGELLSVIELGIQHEQQHQELMLMDIKHVFSCNPIWPVYRPSVPLNDRAEYAAEIGWHRYEEGTHWIGHDSEANKFAFDNESPRHRQFVHAFELADRLVTNAEYLAFVEDGGYQDSQWWLSAGWQTVQEGSWQGPLYWVKGAHGWDEFTLAGLTPLNPQAPVCHVSYFEADAFARWSEKRLPTEAEWEVAADSAGIFPMKGSPDGNLAESELFHPKCADAPQQDAPRQMAGDVWEWTSSSYEAYPGYSPPHGAFGEYNGKFMCNQYVLRGGSCVTPGSHARATYRNFFPPDARWQFGGIRLAK
ncbi:MAG: ergothioneine biosynthesis protein EgtB [Pirellulales bacterium]|nr:ergothioneine biosynthesis protein EgtB [Pirellulales bacterium]